MQVNQQVPHTWMFQRFSHRQETADQGTIPDVTIMEQLRSLRDRWSPSLSKLLDDPGDAGKHMLSKPRDLVLERHVLQVCIL